MKLFNTALGALLLTVSGLSSADWQLNNEQSQLNLVTIKAGNIAEVHRFDTLSGTIKADTATVTIDLTSINTNIEIRDQRMNEFLFETTRFATASIIAQINSKTIDNLNIGDQQSIELNGALNLHGESKTVELGSVLITRLMDNRILVASQQPVIVNAGDFKLTAGVEKLRELAGLPSISNAVPVTFTLVFDEKGA